MAQFIETQHVPYAVPSPFHVLPHFVFTSALWGGYHHPHLTDEGMEGHWEG